MDSSTPYEPRISIQFLATPSASYTIKPYTRLFMYEQSTGSFEIDMIAQQIMADTIYVVPPGFLHYHTEPSICIDAAHHQFDNFFRQLLYYSMYSNTEILAPIMDDAYNFHYFKILALSNNTSDRLAESTRHAIVQRLGRLNTNINIGATRVDRGEELLELVETSGNAAKRLFIKDIEGYMQLDAKGLRRICRKIFNCSPKEIIAHQNLLCIVFAILKQPDSFERVADALGYNDLSNFGRFVKNITGSTLTELRSKLLKRGLDKQHAF